MTDQPMFEPGSTDLDWTACCYVLDELDPPQREAFEQRLENDQAAREAVDNAVRLIGTIAVANPDWESSSPDRVPTPEWTRGRVVNESADRRRPRSRRYTTTGTWACVLSALAAMVLVVLWIGRTADRTRESAGNVEQTKPDQRESAIENAPMDSVAGIWASSFDNAAEDWNEDLADSLGIEMLPPDDEPWELDPVQDLWLVEMLADLQSEPGEHVENLN